MNLSKNPINNYKNYIKIFNNNNNTLSSTTQISNLPKKNLTFHGNLKK